MKTVDRLIAASPQWIPPVGGSLLGAKLPVDFGFQPAGEAPINSIADGIHWAEGPIHNNPSSPLLFSL
jgi:hypothetical protein